MFVTPDSHYYYVVAGKISGIKFGDFIMHPSHSVVLATLTFYCLRQQRKLNNPAFNSGLLTLYVPEFYFRNRLLSQVIVLTG